MPEARFLCLNVLVPGASEDRLVDWLLAHPDWPIEFSAHPVAARGPWVRLARGDEQVQGSARRTHLTMLVERERAPALVQELQRLLAGVDGGWWSSPVEQHGSFGGGAQPLAAA